MLPNTPSGCLAKQLPLILSLPPRYLIAQKTETRRGASSPKPESVPVEDFETRSFSLLAQQSTNALVKKARWMRQGDKRRRGVKPSPVKYTKVLFVETVIIVFPFHFRAVKNVAEVT